MSGFSPEWLALREPVDHRSRSPRIAAYLKAALANRVSIRVVDLGCGSGSNLRATAPLLGADQSWTLVDNDRRLLGEAEQRLRDWADKGSKEGEWLRLEKGGRKIRVAFREADLVTGLDQVLALRPDLVTASALFDLCSTAFIDRFAKAVIERRSCFYTVLTYNGIQRWMPEHAGDTALLDAFHAHQRTDKGFGASAGPDAPERLAQAFTRAGWKVEEGESPWVLDEKDQALIDALAGGFAGAAEETGAVPAATLKAWRAITRTGAVVGHADTLCLPPG